MPALNCTASAAGPGRLADFAGFQKQDPRVHVHVWWTNFFRERCFAPRYWCIDKTRGEWSFLFSRVHVLHTH